MPKVTPIMIRRPTVSNQRPSSKGPRELLMTNGSRYNPTDPGGTAKKRPSASAADCNLRVYRVRPNFTGRNTGIEVLGFFELRDPDRKIPFAITNHFSRHGMRRAELMSLLPEL
jgi:hypothetical protein